MSEKEETTVVEEAVKLAEQAQDKKVFNLTDFIKNRSYPQAEVIVYLDDEAALEIVSLNDQLVRALSPEEAKPLEDKIAALADKIKETSLVFKMRGVNQEVIEAIVKKVNLRHNVSSKQEADSVTGEWMRDYITMMVGENIVSVTGPDGSVDASHFDYDKTDELRKNLPSSEWAKLVGSMEKLTLAGGYFEQITDAGFLQKS